MFELMNVDDVIRCRDCVQMKLFTNSCWVPLLLVINISAYQKFAVDATSTGQLIEKKTVNWIDGKKTQGKKEILETYAMCRLQFQIRHNLVIRR